MAKANKKDDLSKLKFEDAIGQLEQIVDKIEAGDVSLETSLAQYEKGMALIKHCRGILQKAEKKIEKIADEKEGK
jgi:exodeoxyribonuclease VII small subunit